MPKPLSTNAGAVKQRADRAAAKAAKAAEAAGGAPPGPANSTEQIGVETPPRPGEGDDEQAYHCLGCEGPVTKGQTPCPTCGQELVWP